MCVKEIVCPKCGSSTFVSIVDDDRNPDRRHWDVLETVEHYECAEDCGGCGCQFVIEAVYTMTSYKSSIKE